LIKQDCCNIVESNTEENRSKDVYEEKLILNYIELHSMLN